MKEPVCIHFLEKDNFVLDFNRKECHLIFHPFEVIENQLNILLYCHYLQCMFLHKRVNNCPNENLVHFSPPVCDPQSYLAFQVSIFLLSKYVISVIPLEVWHNSQLFQRLSNLKLSELTIKR